jgi:hypothetical protein
MRSSGVLIAAEVGVSIEGVGDVWLPSVDAGARCPLSFPLVSALVPTRLSAFVPLRPHDWHGEWNYSIAP